ncbi:MAG TPA: hypothetical protein DD713_03685 [Nitrospiraceae bacterium]|nr:hypothetical protein [Nitrospiraceae bacterium]
MRRLIIILLMLTLPVAVMAKEKKHIKTAENQECSECHKSQAEAWQKGKHEVMGVKCIVCHGDADKNFAAKPDLYKCRGCHSTEVTDVEKKLPPKMKTCFLCHDAHSITLRFHTKGGE